jgi:hypothetical protein
VAQGVALSLTLALQKEKNSLWGCGR